MDKFNIPRPERESFAKHRRDVNLQIILPIVLVILVGIGLTALSGYAATANNPGVSLWADISIIWLIIPAMLMALVILAVMVALVAGLSRLLKISPHYTGLAQSYALWFNAQVTIWSEKIMNPVLSIRTWLDLILRNKE
jgi:hypothetical protein